MSAETFAVPGLLLMLTAVALSALGVTMLVVAVPLGVSLVLALCAAREEVVHRHSRH